MAATLTLLPPIADQDTPAPEYAKGIVLLAEAMCDAGVKPEWLRPHPALAKYIAPLAERIAARGTP